MPTGITGISIPVPGKIHVKYQLTNENMTFVEATASNWLLTQWLRGNYVEPTQSMAALMQFEEANSALPSNLHDWFSKEIDRLAITEAQRTPTTSKDAEAAHYMKTLSTIQHLQQEINSRSGHSNGTTNLTDKVTRRSDSPTPFWALLTPPVTVFPDVLFMPSA